jgi:hypothetical protein
MSRDSKVMLGSSKKIDKDVKVTLGPSLAEK